MSIVTITTANGKVVVSSPFHRDFPARARAIGGDFARDGSKTWVFDARDESRARDLVREFFGTDGSPADTADLVTVHLDISDTAREREFYFAGRKIAERPSRDENVRLGAGVILVSGGFWSRGGTAKYPAVEPKDGTVVEIRDLPRAAVEAETEKYTIVEEAPAEVVEAAKLRAEREQLLARLAEIDSILGDKDDEDDNPTGSAATDAPAPTVETVPTVPAGTAEFAAVIGRSARTVRRMIAAGKIAARKIGGAWIILPTPATA